MIVHAFTRFTARQCTVVGYSTLYPLQRLRYSTEPSKLGPTPPMNLPLMFASSSMKSQSRSRTLIAIRLFSIDGFLAAYGPPAFNILSHHLPGVPALPASAACGPGACKSFPFSVPTVLSSENVPQASFVLTPTSLVPIFD
ncbi:hypothetical protein C8F04DRAFT_1188427 [Mycena alexandri]|uniref:Uncharacterized protein n=1 Tax=Mycena alexandri TaxID=1745969 RepID=A0AAD6SJB9_9AGAR|nr:hypothetical protein C8F04DRAFT_1190429 [Mycena alexandri]KAJ7028618.1 hypothetical protein C8F04DRAFT_1188427 [Mycena alexandri]